MTSRSSLVLASHHYLAHSEHPFLVILAIVAILLFVLSKIPGVEHIVKPLVGLLFKLIESVGSLVITWGVYSLKLLFTAHITFLKHLILPAEAIDPTDSMRREANKQ